MRKLSKSTYILAIIVIVIFAYSIGMYNYRKPITIHKVFNEAVAIKPSTKEVVKKMTIEINAKLHRGKYSGSIFNFNAHFTNYLEGTMIIDNKEYNFSGFTLKSKLNNIFGFIHEKNQDSSIAFTFAMYDLDSISITTSDYRIAAPAKNLEEYLYIEDKTNKK